VAITRSGVDVLDAAVGGSGGGSAGTVRVKPNPWGELWVNVCPRCGAITLPEDEAKHDGWHTYSGHSMETARE